MKGLKIALLDMQTLTDGDKPLDVFSQFGEVTKSVTLSGGELADMVRDKDVVLCNRSVMSEDIINSAKKLKYIGLFATGYNNVDLAAAKKRGITVCNVPGYSTEAVVQQAMCFLLMLAGSTEKYSAYVKAGKWSFSGERSYFPYKLYGLAGKTIGIFGMGNMGRRMAELCSAFCMHVIYFSRTQKDLPYEFVSKEELFKRSDFLSFHCPVNEETAGVLNKDTIALMKDGAFIINTARGGLIDEPALIDALQTGKIAGAGLDVAAEEPLSADNPLLKAKNVIFTPHVGWGTIETRKRLIELTAENLRRYIEGSPVNMVSI